MSAQLNLTAAGAYAKYYRVGSHSGVFEVGGKIRNAHKYQNATENVYDGWSAASYPMTQGGRRFESARPDQIFFFNSFCASQETDQG